MAPLGTSFFEASNRTVGYWEAQFLPVQVRRGLCGAASPPKAVPCPLHHPRSWQGSEKFHGEVEHWGIMQPWAGEDVSGRRTTGLTESVNWDEFEPSGQDFAKGPWEPAALNCPEGCRSDHRLCA
jgi:hypothetical protein